MKLTPERWRHAGLGALLLFYLILALAFTTRIPLSKAPDEYVHYLYSRFLAEHGRPPINAPERRQAGYKADQPPLYHTLVALATSAIDVSEPPAFKFTWEPAERQLIDIVLPRAILVRTEDETWPYKGVFLAWFAGRWLSVALSAATVAITYFIALELFPGQTGLALSAAAALAFVPRYIFTGAVLSDDNLTGLLLALFLWAVARAVKQPQQCGPGWFAAAIGLPLGLALTTKYSVLLVPLELTLIVIWLTRRQPTPWRFGLTRLLAAGLVTAAVAGLWFGFILWNFNQVRELGPLLGLVNPIVAGDTSDETSALISGLITGDSELVAEATPGPTEGNLFDWARAFFEGFWDVPVFGADRVYPVAWTLLPALVLCGLAGWGWQRRWRQHDSRLWLGLLLLHVVTFFPIPLLRFALTGQIHDTAQARHVLFPAAPALAILLVAGWVAAFPQKWRPAMAAVPACLALLLAGLHLYYFSFAFPPPLPVRSDFSLAGAPDTPLPVAFDDSLRLRGFDWQVAGNQTLQLTLYWYAAAAPAVDYQTEINLRDAAGNIRLRWLSQPAGGRFPTRAWQAGDSVRDTLHIPLAGLPGGAYQVELRLLNWQGQPLRAGAGSSVLLMQVNLAPPPAQSVTLWQSGRPVAQATFRYRATIPLTLPANAEAVLVGPGAQIFAPVTEGGLRLFTVDHTWPSGEYWVRVDGADTGLRLRVENFEWDFTPPEMSHIVNANFNDDLLLLGYDLPLRRVQPGDGLPLVLYWQSLRRIPKSYIIFDRLLDTSQQSWGGYDRLPKETYPTHLWVPGEVVADGFALPVDPAAPDGIYHIVVGLYDQADPAAQSLPLVRNGAPVGETSVRLGPVKVGGPPPEVAVNQSDADHEMRVDFGGVIRLLGYSLSRTGGALQVNLYWQSLAPTSEDVTTFAHLLDESNKIVAQADWPPGNGQYPTSLWDTGEIIANRIDIPLAEAPAGPYRLIIGLYNPVTGRRLPTGDGADSLLLQAIER